MAPVLDGLAQERGEQLPFRATTEPRRRASRAPTSSSARSASASSRAASSTSRSRSTIGVLGQETTGPGGICFALRTIPVMVRARRDDRRARAAAPGSSTSRTRPGWSPRRSSRCSATAWSASATRPPGLCRRVAAALGRDARASCGSTTSASTTSAGCAACTTASATCCPELLADDERLGVVRGGPAVRRRVAALARDDPERVPLLLLLRVRHGRRDPRRARARAASSCSQPAGARSTRRTAARPTRRSRPGARPAASASATYMSPRRTRRRASRPSTRWERRRRLRGRGDRGRRGDRAQRRARVLILNTANRSSLPFLDERAVVEVPCVVGRAGPVPVAVGDVPDHARALIETIKAVERTTIEAALHRLARARGQGARAAPARAVGQHRAADLRRLPRPAARARGALRMSVDVVCTGAGLPRPDVRRARDACPGPGEERFAERPARARPAAARSPRSAPRASASRPRSSAPLGDDLAGRPAARACSTREGVALRRPATATRTPVTVVLPFDGERAMVDLRARRRASTAAEVAALRAARGRRRARPARRSCRTASRGYATVGDADARALRRRARRPTSARARALLVNRARGARCSPATDAAERRPRALAEQRRDRRRHAAAPTAPWRAPSGELVHVPRLRRSRPVDTTGAGDLFVRRLRVGGPGGAAAASGCAGGRVRDPSPCTGPTGRRRGHAGAALGGRLRPAACRRWPLRRRRHAHEARSIVRPAVLLLTAVVAGCGTPGGDSCDNAKKADAATKNSAKVDVAKAGDVTLTSGTRRSAAARTPQMKQLNAAVPGRSTRTSRSSASRSRSPTSRRRSSSRPRARTRPTSSRPTRATRRWARSSRPGCCTRSTRYAEAYGWNDRYSTDAPDAEQVHLRRQARSAPATSTALLADRRGRRRLLQQGRRSADACRRRSPSSSRRSPKAKTGRRDADPVRQPRQVAGHPRVRGAVLPDRRQAGDARLHLRARAARRFDTPGTRAAATKLQDWAKKGYFTQGLQRHSATTRRGQQFGKGKGVFLITGSWLTADLKKALGKDVGFFLLPPRGGRAPGRRSAARACRGRSARSRRTPTSRRPTSTSSPTPTPPSAGRDRQPAGDEGDACRSPAGLDTEVFNAWTKLNDERRDRPVPRLGDADDVRHDHGRDPGAAGRQDDAGRRSRQGPVRLLEVP